MKAIQISNILVFIAVVVVNALANALPIGGLDTGELSDLYPNLFVPTGATFSIWGIIYLLLAVFVIRQAKGLFGNAPTPDFTKRIGWLFVANGILNITWILVWHHQMTILSLLVMLGILGTLGLIYRALGTGLREVSKIEYWTVHLVFSIYLGWICIATIANFTTVLVDFNWSGFGISEVTWAIVLYLVGAFLGLYFLFIEKNVPVGLVVAWALYGIYLKRSSSVPTYSELSTLALVLTFLLLLSSIYILIKKIRN